MLLEVKVQRKHRTSDPYQTRGRGAPGGWVWASNCLCGWRSWSSPNPDSVLEQIVMHWNDERTMVDILNDAGRVQILALQLYSWRTSTGVSYRWSSRRVHTADV